MYCRVDSFGALDSSMLLRWLLPVHVLFLDRMLQCKSDERRKKEKIYSTRRKRYSRVHVILKSARRATRLSHFMLA